MVRSFGLFAALCAFLLFAPGMSARAQTPAPADLTGDWFGLLSIQGHSLPILFHIRPGASTMDSPEQNASGLAVSAVTETDGKVRITLDTYHIAFEATRTNNADMLDGQFLQGGASFPLRLTRVVQTASPAPADIVGDWWGVLTAPGGIGLHFIFHIHATGYSTFDIPDQNLKDIPLSAVSETGDTVHFEMRPGDSYYEGKRVGDGFDGQFHQGEASFPVKLQRGLPPVLNRPQTPKPPFPYRNEDVGYENTVQHVHLAGTLTLPEGKGPFPVALLITGSGQQDRDETILGHKPFFVIADYLTRRGIAVLRVDDRGAGRSTGNFATSTTADFATDVEAGVAYLKSRPDIDKRHIGLVGHSEGGFIAPMVAAKDPSIAFIVMMAGPGLSGADISRFQVRNTLEQAHTPADQIEKTLAIQDKVTAVASSNVDDTKAREEIADILAVAGISRELAEQKAAAAAAPWTRWWFAHDPAPVLREVHCPVLAINGSKDTQVPPAINLPAIRAALKGNPDATVEELPGLNHLFQHAGTGQPDEYAKIEETIAPEALKIMGDWITAHAGK